MAPATGPFRLTLVEFAGYADVASQAPDRHAVAPFRLRTACGQPLMETEKMNRIERSKRLDKLPPYLFVEIDRVKNELKAAGKDVVDLGIGDPDLPTLPEIVSALQEAAADPATHRYPLQRGLPSFKKAIARWYEARYGVSLDPVREVLPLIGTKEGIGHLPLAVMDADDIALIPDPAFPIYTGGLVARRRGRAPHPSRTREGLPAGPRVAPQRDELDRARLLFLNYPNNPTGAVGRRRVLQGRRRLRARQRAHRAQRRGLLRGRLRRAARVHAPGGWREGSGHRVPLASRRPST